MLTFVVALALLGSDDHWPEHRGDMHGVFDPSGSSITGPLRLNDGTAAAPAYSFNLDTDTGMYRVGANDLGFSAGGTLRLDISSALITMAENATLTETGTQPDLTVNSINLNAVGGPLIDLTRANNPLGAILTASTLGTLRWQGYDGTAYGVGASMRSASTEAWNNTSHGSSLVWKTTTNGTTTATDRWQIDNAGHWFASSDNTYDIGASAGNRPRVGYFAGGVKTQGLGCKITTIVFANSPYIPTTSDCLILCDATGGAINITPTAGSNYVANGSANILSVKKIDSSVNTCTWTPNGLETVDGAASDVIVIQNISHNYASDASNWFIF